MQASDVTRLDHATHVLLYPDTYIGAVVPLARSDIVASPTWELRVVDVHTAPGVLKCFDEIFHNALDNVIRTVRRGLPAPDVAVRVDGWSVEVHNTGCPIPVEVHPVERVWVPDLLFGTLLTSSTYTETGRLSAGRNGYGGKIVNIFSQRFRVEVVDAQRHRRYVREWRENMRESEPAVVTDGAAGAGAPVSSVTVRYTLDHARFGLPADAAGAGGGGGGYPDDALGLMRRTVVDGSMCCRVPITFNGERVPLHTGASYMRALCGSATAVARWRHADTSDAGYPLLEFVAAACVPAGAAAGAVPPQSGPPGGPGAAPPPVISFANGTRTVAGGVHVEAVWRRLHKALAAAWPGTTQAEMKANVALLVLVSVPDPAFRGQMKEYLNSPAVAVAKLHPQRDLAALLGCAPLRDACLARARRGGAAGPGGVTDGGAGGAGGGAPPNRYARLGEGGQVLHVDNLHDATDAGGAGGRAARCTLLVIEGRSGLDYATTLASALPGGRARNGIMEDRGIVINAFEDGARVRDSRDFLRLSAALGGPAGARRYGRIVLLSDQDSDGAHINALKIAMLARHFPDYLVGHQPTAEGEATAAAVGVGAPGRLLLFRTPLVRVGGGSSGEVFYDEAAYAAWAAEGAGPAARRGGGAHVARYMKGLGSSTRQEVLEDLRRPGAMVTLVTDAATEDTLALFFSAARQADRAAHIARAHLAGAAPLAELAPGVRTITNYFLHEVTAYCVACNARSLPAVDGLKLGQRKVLWAAWRRFAPRQIPERGLAQDPPLLKVAQLAGYVAETMHYHHDEATLSATIVRLASPYTNNFALLEPRGNFGTLDDGLDGASPARYIFTRPAAGIFAALFPARDVPLLRFTPVENERCEPDFLLPVMPVALLNGAHGIGAGFQAYVPPHHPLEVIAWLERRLRDEPRGGYPLPRPYFHRFHGKTVLVTAPRTSATGGKRKRRRCLDGAADSPADGAGGAGGTDDDHTAAGPRGDALHSWRQHLDLESRFEVLATDRRRHTVDLVVTSLPPGVPLRKFRAHIDTLVEAGLIARRVDESRSGVLDHTSVRLLGVALRARFPKDHPLHARAPPNITAVPLLLGLRRIVSMDNMVLLSAEGHVRRYPTVGLLLEQFYQFRLPFYAERAAREVREMEESLRRTEAQARFVQAVVAGHIDLLGPEAAILRALAALDIAPEIYRAAKLDRLCQEAIASLLVDLGRNQARLAELRQATPASLWLHDLAVLKAYLVEHEFKDLELDHALDDSKPHSTQ